VTYTELALIALGAVVFIDLGLTRTRLLRRRAFWVSYAIVLGFQLVVNGVLTGLPIVRYRSSDIVGLRIAYAPVEDLLFGFCLVLLTLSLWVWFGRRANHAASSPRPPTQARRPGPTATRSEKTS
jgi:lycopene cyclase domain-containing protein